MLLSADASQLVLIDYQPRLLPALHDGAAAEAQALRLAHPAAYLDVLDRLVATADDPAVLGTAGHLLYVGRRAQR